MKIFVDVWGSLMSIYEDILKEFFEELKEDNEIPNAIMEKLEILIEEDKIKSDDIINMIKRGALNG